MNLTEAQLRILRHMLGINDPWKKEATPYRDNYCANRDDPNLAELARLGAVVLVLSTGDYSHFKTTPAGRAAAIASYKKIRKPRAARRYRAFLRCRDFDYELDFRTFLTSEDYRLARMMA